MMKTTNIKIATLALFLAYCNIGHAQNSVAIKLGLNSSSIATDYSLDPTFLQAPKTKSRAGILIGVTFGFELSEKVSLQPGLLFNSKGFSSDQDLAGDDFDKVTINYLELPVNTKFNFTDNFYGLFGPYFSLGVGGNNKWEYAGQSGDIGVSFVSSEVSFDEFNDSDGFVVRGFDYGFNMGLGYSFEPFSIEVGYSIGLGNSNPTITDFPVFGTIAADDYKHSNRVLSISISYNIMN